MRCSVLLLTIGCILATAFGSCKKDDSVQGPPDYGDPNYLVCRVDGKLRKSLGLDNWNRRTGVAYDRSVARIGLSGDNDVIKDALGVYVDLPVDSIRTDTPYYFGGEKNLARAEYVTRITDDGMSSWSYFTRVASGWVRFSKIDATIAAGTFSFTAYRSSQPGVDSVVITNGEFSIASK